jgi:NADH-quinone oxidoreductase subunit E
MVLSPQDKEVLEGLLKEAEGLDSPILFLLHRIQERWGQISWDSANFISQNLYVPMTQIYSAATFYEEFTIKPIGKNIIRICRGIVCHSNDSLKILNSTKEHLGIDEGETTEDGMFTLMESSCIGQCDGAPALMINDNVYRNISADSVIELLNSIRTGGD